MALTIEQIVEAIKELSKPEQVFSNRVISGGDKAEFTIGNDLGKYSAIIVTVKATYDPSATAGVRVRWLYSPNGADYDSPEDAEDQGNYEDLTFAAGKTRQRTVVIPIALPYVKVQIVNLDSAYPVTVDVWKTLVR